MSRFVMPAALTIAGSDSCGGAGIQADLKTFTVLGVYGMSVITAVTAQNTLGVQGAQELSTELVQQQIDSVADDIAPQAIKTGMLASIVMIEVVAAALARFRCPYVCDPVMVSKTGHSLIAPDAVQRVRKVLLPLAAVITPNRFEARQLLGGNVPLETVADAIVAARRLGERTGAVVIKGIRDGGAMVDVVYEKGGHELIEGPLQPAGRSHGSGCTFSAAITAGLARGMSVLDAVKLARKVIDWALANSFSGCKGVHPVNVVAYQAG